MSASASDEYYVREFGESVKLRLEKKGSPAGKAWEKK